MTGGVNTSINGTFTQSGGGAVSLGGTLQTTNQNILFTDAVSLSGAAIVSSGTGTGNLHFSSTIDGNSSLDLTAGTGNIQFDANLGSTSALGALTIHSVQTITYPTVHASSITQSGASGTTTISGAMTALGSGGISLSGGVMAQNGTLSSQGPIAMTNSGLLTIGANVTAAGTYTQSGTGNVLLGNTIQTTNSAIAFTGSGTIALSGATSLVTGPLSGNISVASSTIDGADDLTLSAAGGSISFGGAIGSTVRLRNVQVVSAADASFAALTVYSISQIAGTGITTFHGAVDSSYAVSLTGHGFTIDNTFLVASGGLTVSNTGGSFTLDGGASLTLQGGSGNLLQNTTGPCSLNGSVVAGGSISFSGPVLAEIGGTASLSTAASNQPITFLNTINGSGNLTLASGTNNITLNANVGGSATLGALTLASGGVVLTKAIHAASIVQTGSAATTFDGDVIAEGAGGIGVQSAAVTFTEDVAANGGAFTLTNSGLAIFSPGKTVFSSGAFLQNGAGTVSLGSNIATSNANLEFTRAITLTSAVVLSTGSGAGNILLDSTVNGNRNVTLEAGTGSITASGEIGGGAAIGQFIIQSAANVSLPAITSFSIQQVSGTGTTTLNSALNTSGSPGIVLSGNQFALNGTITTTNGGPLSITNSGALTGLASQATSLSGSFTQSGAGSVGLDGSLTTAFGSITFAGSGPITLGADSTLDSSSSGNNVSIANPVNGAHVFDVVAGDGNATLSGTVGASLALSSFTVDGRVVSVGNIGGLSAGVTGATNVTAASNMTLSGSTYNANGQTYTSAIGFNMTSGVLTTFTSSGDAIDFAGGATIFLSDGSDLSIYSHGGNITMGAVRADPENLIFDGGAGDITVGAIGAPNTHEVLSVSIIGANLFLTGDIYSDTVTLSPSVKIFSGGSIYTTDTSLTFPKDVELTASVTFSTKSASGGDMLFSGAVQGDGDYTRSLILNSGGGDITFNGPLNVLTQHLNQLTIVDARNVAASSAIGMNGLTQNAGTGTTTLSGALTIGASGLRLTGQNFSISNTVAASDMIVNNNGQFTLSGAVVTTGLFTQNNANGTTLFSGSITSQQPVSFAGAVSLSGSPTIDTSVANQPISFSKVVNGSGGLTLSPGVANVTFSQDLGGSTRLGALLINNGGNINAQSITAASIDLELFTGTFTYGNLNTNGPGNAIVLKGQNFVRNGNITTTNLGSLVVTNSGTISGSVSNTSSIDGSYTQNGTGPVNLVGSITTVHGNISYASPLTLTGASTLSAGGNIAIAQTIDGLASLSMSAAGTISINGAIGSLTELASLVFGYGTVHALDQINAGSIVQLSGSATFDGALATTGIGGIQLAGVNFTRNAAWTAYNEGPIVVNNSGVLLSPASAGLINASGGFNQSGVGPVAFGGTILTNADAISFSGPLTLSANSLFDTGIGASISFHGTVNGTYSLDLLCGDGDVLFAQAVGLTTPLGDITVPSAHTFTLSSSLNAESLVLTSGSGAAFLNVISGNGGWMNSLNINAANILFGGAIYSTSVNFIAQGSILNSGLPVAINTSNNVLFNAWTGNVGSFASPVLINTGGEITAGTVNYGIAVLNGSSIDGTVHEYALNPPCQLYFNGVQLKDCGLPPPVPPSPPPLPSEPLPPPLSPAPMNAASAVGFNSSFFNLASPYYFTLFFISQDYFNSVIPNLYYKK